MNRILKAALATTALVATPSLAAAVEKADVLTTYADIAAAAYGDSLTTAQALQAAVDTLIANPSPEALEAAKAAWLEARVPYQQTEAFRFGNAIVDDWEGKVNAWPLDEGLIDYVDRLEYGGATDENAVRRAQRHRQSESSPSRARRSMRPRSRPSFCRKHPARGRRGRGERGHRLSCYRIPALGAGPERHRSRRRCNGLYSDYRGRRDDCTGGNCDRRGAYLTAAVDLLVSDLEWMVGAMGRGRPGPRDAAGGPRMPGIAAMLTGHGFSLSYGELAGERMKLGVHAERPRGRA